MPNWQQNHALPAFMKTLFGVTAAQVIQCCMQCLQTVPVISKYIATIKPSEHYFVFESFDNCYKQKTNASWTFRCLTLLNTITSKSKCHGRVAVWVLAAFHASTSSTQHVYMRSQYLWIAEIHHIKAIFETCLFGWGLLGPNKNDSSTQTDKNTEKVLRAPWNIKGNKTKQRYGNLVQRANQTVCCGCG